MDLRSYLFVLLVGFGAYTAMLYIAGRVREKRLSMVFCLAQLVPSMLLCWGLAYGGYELLQIGAYPTQYPYCFTLGVAGVVVSLCLMARLFRISVGDVLDNAFPAIAILVGIARLAETHLGSIGTGDIIWNEALQWKPLAVVNEWEEWYLAVFVLEALLAFVAIVVYAVMAMKKQPAGLLFERAIVLLLAAQILFEQLRSQTMAWGFVRVEQVLCAVLIEGIMLHHAFMCEKKGVGIGLALLQFIPVGIIMAAEFALDGKLVLPLYVSWGMIVLGCAAMVVLSEIAARRRLTAAR